MGAEGSQPVVKVSLHSTADASRPAAFLVGRILPVFSLLAPGGAGASAVSGATWDFHHGLLRYSRER